MKNYNFCYWFRLNSLATLRIGSKGEHVQVNNLDGEHQNPPAIKGDSHCRRVGNKKDTSKIKNRSTAEDEAIT